MEFKQIKDELESKNLENPFLKILHPDNNQYFMLAFQPRAEIEVNGKEKYLKSKDRELIISKYDEFFKLALDKKVELAVCPEYSCPWESIDNLLNNNILPVNESIWILGCESKKPSEIKRIIQNKTNDKTIFIYDEEIIDSREDKYLNTVAHIFKTNDNKNTEITVLVLQFKVYEMGGVDFEKDNMLKGKYGYIFMNNKDLNSICLITLICSESLNFKFEENFPKKTSLIIIHPQLNVEPRNDSFKKYRNEIFSYAHEYTHQEIFCLNWARNTKLEGCDMKYGASTYFLKSLKTCTNPSRINHNDKKGIFYNYWNNKQANVYTFIYDEAIFYFKNDKASQELVNPENVKRQGLIAEEIYSWGNNTWKPESELECLLERNCKDKQSLDFKSFLKLKLSPINKERYICLSCGNVEDKKWFLPNKNKYFQINDNEYINRILFQYDPKTCNNKSKIITKLGNFIHELIKDKNTLPEVFCADNRKIECYYFDDTISNIRDIDYCLNVIDDNGLKYCFVYLGDNPKSFALEKLELLTDIFLDSSNTSNFDHASMNYKLILVCYREGELKYEFNGESPKISEDNKSSQSVSRVRR